MDLQPIPVSFPLLGPGGKYYPGRRPQIRDVAESRLGSVPRPRHGDDLEEMPAEWLEHLEALSRRAAAGLPISTGYQGHRTAAGLAEE